jgi:uncharacterized protein (TIRG00374 family)
MRKAPLRYILKILLTLGIIGIAYVMFQKSLFEKQNLMEGILHHCHHLNYLGLFFALGIFIFNSFLSALRIFMLTCAYRIPISYWKLLKNLYIGYLFNPLLMGSTGGDVVRSYYLMKQTSKKAEIVTVLFLDRFVGMVVMALLAVGSLIFNAKAMGLERELYIFIGVILFLLGFFWIGSSHKVKNIFSQNLMQSSKAKKILQQIFETIHHARGHWKPMFFAALCSLCIQSLMIVACWIVSLAMQEGPEIPLRYFFLFLPVIFTVSAIPIMPGGALVGETAYASLFSFVDVSAVDAITISLLTRGVLLVTSFMGAFVYLFPEKKHAKLGEVLL